MKLIDFTASVVLYKNDPNEIEKLLSCFNDIKLSYEIFLVDNSPTDSLKIFENRKHLKYFFVGENLGFGKAQNLAIEKIFDVSKYHLILNPDVVFNKEAIENIFNFMEAHNDVGQLMPKIFYPDGTIQKLCKLLPEPWDLLGRRFFANLKSVQKRNARYELEGFNYNKVLDTPNLSGCFMFLRTSVLKKVKGFDTRYFMYLEDFDLTRRINEVARTIFYPGASIIHAFNKGSYNNPVLFRYHIVSAIKYFNKWGWFFDDKRSLLNKKILAQLSTATN